MSADSQSDLDWKLWISSLCVDGEKNQKNYYFINVSLIQLEITKLQTYEK